MRTLPVLGSMVMLRILSGLLEIVTAVIILRSSSVQTALRLNAFLGLVGPIVFLAVSALGIISIAVKLPLPKVLLICTGLLLVLWGTSK
ncbi:MAG TPA: DUF2619 domain-containing protein [Firmicutes bacterium]|nr:DUF2619 domain-containing protein [Bacillota bacterium]